MRLVDQLLTLRRTFATNRGRAMLTLLGIMIGAGSLVLLTSILRGGEEALLRSNQLATGADVVRVDREAPPTRDQYRPRRELSQSDADLLAGSPLLPGAQVSTERVRMGIQARYGKRDQMVTLVGADPVALSLHRLKVARGRFLDPDDLRQRSRVCVVGSNVWGELLGGAAGLDDLSITVDGVQWSVVGVLETKPSMGGNMGGPFLWNNKVLVPATTYDARFFNGHGVDEIYVRIGGVGVLDARLMSSRAAIASAILRNHYGVENFKIDRWAKNRQQRDLIVGVIESLLLGTCVLSMFVGGINIMNIMLVTVTERTREIGVRRAVGASPSSILMQFLLESGFIALTGGIIGVLGGIGLAALVAAALSKALGGWNLHVVPWSVALGLALSLATGVAFGLFPAWRAARLDPVEALRYE